MTRSVATSMAFIEIIKKLAMRNQLLLSTYRRLPGNFVGVLSENTRCFFAKLINHFVLQMLVGWWVVDFRPSRCSKTLTVTPHFMVSEYRNRLLPPNGALSMVVRRLPSGDSSAFKGFEVKAALPQTTTKTGCSCKSGGDMRENMRNILADKKAHAMNTEGRFSSQHLWANGDSETQ